MRGHALRAAWARGWVIVETRRGPVGRPVGIATDGVVLQADLVVPEDPLGIVAFAHGSGSGRFSPRNRFVASALNEAGLGTLLADLLTASEERVDARTAELRFDIDLLTRRLIGIVDWLSEDEATHGLAIGLFGASTGAAAAVRVGAARPGLVGAIVSRGGRVDLAADELPRCTAPTLLIVGGDDRGVPRAESPSPRPKRRDPEAACGRRWSDAPVRGARRTRAGRAVGGNMVPRAPRRDRSDGRDEIKPDLVDRKVRCMPAS